MDHYLQPIISRGPDHVILHIGTNNLSNSRPEEVVRKIVNLLKEHGINVIVSSLIIRSGPMNHRVIMHSPPTQSLFCFFTCVGVLIEVNELLKTNSDKEDVALRTEIQKDSITF